MTQLLTEAAEGLADAANRGDFEEVKRLLSPVLSLFLRSAAGLSSQNGELLDCQSAGHHPTKVHD